MSEYIQNILGTLHQPRTIFSPQTGTSDFCWNPNGNLLFSGNCKDGAIRQHAWDEENRLWLVVGNSNDVGYYGYDADGNRVYKLTGIASLDYINGGKSGSSLYFDGATLYPSPYITVTKDGYTKHYFTGSERIATVIGDGQWIHAKPIDGWHDAHDMDIALYFKYPEWGYPLGEQGYTYTVQNEDIYGKVQEELAYDCEPAILKLLYWKMPGPLLKEVMTRHTEPHWDEGKIYYYHGDHLGSASWITDAIGAPAQYLHYLPYGEIYANQVLSFKELILSSNSD